MSRFSDKIRLTLGAYWQAWSAIRRMNDPDLIAQVRDKKLGALTNHAASHVKYYRELFEKEGIRPEQVRSTEDLLQIPFLTKEDIRTRFWDFPPKDLPACRVSRTSGSTGVPICPTGRPARRSFWPRPWTRRATTC